MFLHSQSGVRLVSVLIVIAGSALSDQMPASPFRNELGYQYFVSASKFPSEILSSVTSNTNYEDRQCAIDIRRILAGLQNFEDWAIEFPDSWGRLPFGLMWGHTISMGQFEECVTISRAFDIDYLLKGKYCLAKIPIKGFVEKINKTSDLSRAISYKKKDPEYFELGICVPSSCSANMADNLLKTIIKTVFNQDIKDNRTVDEQYCKVDEPIKLRPIDIFAIAFILFIVFCMLASSIYDYIQTKKGSRKHPLFLAFSVITNAKKVFSVKKVDSPDVIHCLNGIRCFSMMWVVMGHGYMTFYDLPHINKNKFFTWTETPFSMLVQNGTLCVDTFFFMSGLLMLWGAFREMEKTKGKLNIPMMYFHRYIRLTPVVAVVILYIMSLYKYSGAGPMWMKLGTQDKRCEDTWWATLLYVQNYAFPNKICISQSWYLAVDTQLYVLSPIFLIPLWKWGKKSLPPMIVLILLCIACTFATFMFNDFTLFRVQDEHVDLRQRLTYYPTHTRIPTWLMGVIFGYFLFTKNRGRKIPLAKRWVISGWLVAFGIMLTDLWGPYWRIRPENPDSPIIEGAFYEPLSRAAWALSMAWIVWACYNGHGGLINDFLSWSFFAAFSRLTYCMYVIHRIVQLVNAARLQTDTHFSDYDAVMRWWHDFGLTLCASIFATLAFESPILGIEKAIFGSVPDSWGRLPFGLMWGHTISMGQFEECVTISRAFDIDYLLKGKYCLAKIPIKGFVEKINKTSDLSRAISYKKKDPEYFELGICVPSSCSANMADNLLKTIIKTVFNQDIKDNRTVDEQYCKVDEPIKLRPIDIFAIAFILFIVFCMLASSIYDYIQTKKGSRKHPLFLAFSVITNAKKVFSVKKVDSPDVIHCLNGIRCFSMM